MGQDTIIEVKCPFSGKEEKVGIGEHFPFLEEREGQLRVKKQHSYYYQWQGQMACTKMSRCIFIVYTNCDLFTDTIYYNEEFCSQAMLPVPNDFFDKHYKPFIVSQM